MPRIPRGLAGGEVYHIINRGNRKNEVFHEARDCEIFTTLMQRAKKMTAIKLYAYALMPNHFHFIIKPTKTEDLSKYMQWLLTSYVRYYNKTYQTSGHLWQGRYKSFIVQKDYYLLNLYKYVIQNPKRAKLKNWSYVSEHHQDNELIDSLPIDLPENWLDDKNQKISNVQKKEIESSIKRQSPYGEENWKLETCKKYDILSTIRAIGRPKKEIAENKK